MSDEYKEYCISYQHKGASWGAQVLATSFEDARARVRAIGTTGVVDGDLVMTVPAKFGM